MRVGNSASPTEALYIRHDGVVDLKASTFVLNGHTCSIVATVVTCP